jgi:hypothetical protein
MHSNPSQQLHRTDLTDLKCYSIIASIEQLHVTDVVLKTIYKNHPLSGNLIYHIMWSQETTEAKDT